MSKITPYFYFSLHCEYTENSFEIERPDIRLLSQGGGSCKIVRQYRLPGLSPLPDYIIPP